MGVLGEMAVQAAVSKLGVEEVGGNNRGPDVEVFLSSVGLPPGQPWCAAFVFWCFKQAASRLGRVSPCPKTGAGMRLWHLADSVCRLQGPARGRVYVLSHGGGLSHVGIVEAVNEDGTVVEVSGNTNKEGSREGNCVWRHTGDPAKVHGGTLVGYLDFDRAAGLVA